MIFQFKFESILSRKVRELQAQILVQAETLPRQAPQAQCVTHLYMKDQVIWSTVHNLSMVLGLNTKRYF